MWGRLLTQQIASVKKERRGSEVPKGEREWGRGDERREGGEESKGEGGRKGSEGERDERSKEG